MRTPPQLPDLLEAAPQPRKRLKLTPLSAAEDDIHESVARAFKYLLLPPTMWTTMPAGGYALTEAAAARLFRIGYQPGWPDVQIVHLGIFHGIELKTATGRLSKTRIVRTRWGRPRHVTGQEEVLANIKQAGGKVAVCRSLDEVLNQVRVWGIPTREAA